MNRQNFHYNADQQQQATSNQAMMENDAAALAAEMFDHFCAAMTMRQILGLFRSMCDTIGLRPGPINEFYPKLKAKLKNWKAQALWKKFDARLAHRVYNKGTACNGTRVLVIGAGPCGLRTAIEAQFLGAKVVVVEKRDRITRNNVLHLWPFLIHDLRSLGAKKFYGKFCAGSIDHISIRQLQVILLKVALILGIDIQENVGFEKLIEPSDGCGWRALIDPPDHAVSHFEFDALIGADGKRYTLEGFKRKEFRGKLAIAITANFINKKTEAEARVQEISGVAFIFNQSFFKELYHETGIDLENIVYYKDETHYFVMTAKKHSLLDKGVIIQDCSDPAELLHPNNVNSVKLQDYAREAADFSTKYQMPNLEFAVNHYGKPDCAMFDFTSMFQAENSSRIVVRKNYRLLSCLVGDSLLEPFWPSGSGCARGFLSGMDAAYAIKLLSNPNNSALAVLAQRESIYRLLAQTTPENLSRDHGGYTLDPVTRYPNLNRQFVLPHQMKHLLDTDDPSLLEQTFMDTNAIQSVPEPPARNRKRRTADMTPLGNVLLGWIKSHLKDQDFVDGLTEPSQCFTHGKVLVALINRYRPDLLDWSVVSEFTPEDSNEIAFQILENDLNIPRVMSAADSVTLENIDSKIWHHYLEQICEVFRGEIPHVKHPKMDYAEFKQKNQSARVNADFARLHRIAAARREAIKDENGASHANGGGKRLQKLVITEKATASPLPQNVEHRRGRKRRSYEKYGNIEERMARLADIDVNRQDRQNRRRYNRKMQTENFLKSLHMLQANNYLREGDENSAFEDYSIFMYRQQAPEFNDRVKDLEKKLLYPDRERGIQSALPRAGIDEQFSDRIRDIEEKFTTKNAAVTNKKPKDLLRAIGKIESNDWNVKEIEKKMEMSKKTTDIGKSREKVPKWSREQFLARHTKMSKPDRQDSSEQKYKEIDNTLKALDKQLKEGSVLDRGERGKNKVASIAGSFGKKKEEENGQTAQKAGLILTSSGISEACHFCKQRVYLMEKISAEGLVLHRSCLKCHHCHTNLRLGGYAFDRESPDGKFYCTQHFKLPPKDVKFVPKRLLHKQRQHDYEAFKAQRRHEHKKDDDVDLIDNRRITPERIEFENDNGGPVDDQIMDENEWTDLNFGTGSDESADEESSTEETDSDSDSDMFEDPVGVDAQTLQLASEWIDKRSTMQDSEDEFYGYSSEDDDADSQTEGEELAKAREMRMNEVKLQPPLYVLTDTETEGVSKAMTQNNDNNNESNNLQSQTNNLISNSSLNLQSHDNPNPKDELLKSDMMKKLSLKEKWLLEQSAAASLTPPPKVIEPMEVDHQLLDENKKEEKKSFFSGVISSVKHLIKPDKDHSREQKTKSKTPPSVKSVDLDKLIKDENINVENFDELVVESDKPQPGTVSKKIEAFLKKQKSEDIREDADGILNEIKEGNEKMAKQMRDMEQRRFSTNMQAIKSSVVDSKVASMKEVNLSKYFPTQQEKKPPAVAKNRDVKALKDVNLSKYFPSSSSPTSGKRTPVSPTVLSATSSANASPLMPRKNINEIDLGNYFPGTPTLSRKTSFSTPPGSPLTENPPTLDRRDSISRIVVYNSIPPPPPPPIAKKNVLSLQTIKKRQPVAPLEQSKSTETEKPSKAVTSKQEKLQNNKKEKSPSKIEPRKASLKDEFNMFDQLLDGAIDIEHNTKTIDDIDLDNFDALIDEVKLERSPSKEYAKIFEGNSKRNSVSKEITPEADKKQNDSKTSEKIVEQQQPEAEQKLPEKKKSGKPKKKKPKKVEKPEILDKLAIDPKIIQNLTNEYQRLLLELERSSKSPETETSTQHTESSEYDVILENPMPIKISPLAARLDNKRKSPQRSEECKKFKEEEVKETVSEEVKIIENPVDDDSLIARLERKYRRNLSQNNETQPEEEAKTSEETVEKSEESYSIIERLERKLKQKKEINAQPENVEIIKESLPLASVQLVKIQNEKQPKDFKEPIKSFNDVNEPAPDEIFEEISATQGQNINETINPLIVTKPKVIETELPYSTKKSEIKCFESLLNLPKEGIDDIFSEFELTEKETEKALRDFQESYDSINKDQGDAKKSNVSDPIPIENVQQKRKSLQIDLAEIDCGISERPLNLNDLIPRRRSIEESLGIPDSPKSFNSNEEIKVASTKDSAYSGSGKTSRKSSTDDKEIQKEVKKIPKSVNNEVKKKEIAASYINVLKEISNGLIGFDEEPMVFMTVPEVTVEPKKAEITTESAAVKESAKESYAKVLQDISHNLVGLDFCEIEPKKNYSQVIPPSVQDIAQKSNIKRVPSANILEVPNAEKIREFLADAEDIVDIKIPVPPVRRHKSVENSQTPEPTIKSKRLLPSSKSFEYETISGRTSKNSTEYYDQIYPSTNNGAKKLDPQPATRVSNEGGFRTRNRQRAIDDLLAKSANSRGNEDMKPPRRQTTEIRRSEEADGADSSFLLEKSQMLHRRKESFMRDQISDSNNPYIREMMKQDVDNPIDISDIKFIRRNPTVPLLSNSYLSSYQPRTTTSSSYATSRTPISYGRVSHASPVTYSRSSVTNPVTSYSRPTVVSPIFTYKSPIPATSSISYLNPSSSTAAHILTKAHTISPHSSSSTSYTSRQRPITSLSDPITTSSRLSRPTSQSQKKSSGSTRDACSIS